MYQLYDLKSIHYNDFRSEAKQRIGKIIDENSFIEGEYNQKFEKEFAELQGSNFCRLVANGTDAIEIALKAYDIEQGDYVGIPGITFYATAEAVYNIGATPILIDVEDSTGVMCPKSLERVSEKFNLKAVIAVHIYGIPCKMDQISHLCRSKNIKIIEDAAQASGTITPMGPAGANPYSLSTFSFYPTKNLSAMGDAGAILCSDYAMAKKIETIRNHGRGGYATIGRNSRCDHFQAAILHLKLKDIEKQNESRKRNAKLYFQYISNPNITLLPNELIETSSWHLFPLRLKNKDEAYELVQFLRGHQIGSSNIYYEKSMGMEPALDGVKGERQIADSLAGKVVCIPITPFLTLDDIKFISAAVNKFKNIEIEKEHETRPQLQ